MITAAKAVFDLLIPDENILVSDYEEQQGHLSLCHSKNIILNVVLGYLSPVLSLH